MTDEMIKRIKDRALRKDFAKGANINETLELIEMIENNRNKKYCAWTIEDPMSMYHEMTEDQAIAVMNLVERHADYDLGVTYDSIRDAVSCLYPDMKSADDEDCEEEDI